MLDLETSVLSKTALKAAVYPSDQPPTPASSSNSASISTQASANGSASADGTVFFRVFEVAEGGPAQAAGLLDGDTVRHACSRCCCYYYRLSFSDVLTRNRLGSICVQHIGVDHASQPVCSASSVSGGRGQRWWMHVVAGGQVLRAAS